MNQLLKKCALLAVYAALALGFTTQSAQAQLNTTHTLGWSLGASGDHLIFPYWSTQEGTDTLLTIHSPLGAMLTGETKNVIQVAIEDNMGGDKGMFPICLMPGDSWTAVLSSSGDGMSSLTVADAGECDSSIHSSAQAAPTRANPSPLATPAKGESVTVKTDMGLIHAYTRPIQTLTDADPTDSTSAAANITDDAYPRAITGNLYLVSAMGGFSSGYTAGALLVTDATGDAGTANEATGNHNASTGIGCGVKDLNPSSDTSADSMQDMRVGGCTATEINTTMTGMRLIGRWSALADENITTSTSIVVTFPGDSPLQLLAGVTQPNDTTNNTVDAVAVEASTDAVSLFLFDDTGAVDNAFHTAMLGKDVNMCAIGMDDMDDKMMVSCNGESLGSVTATGGGFHIINNKAGNVEDAAADYTDTNKYSDGKETSSAGTGFNNAITPDISDVNVDSGGNLVTADDDGASGVLPALGFAMSFFEGTDGKMYDQLDTLQVTAR